MAYEPYPIDGTNCHQARGGPICLCIAVYAAVSRAAIVAYACVKGPTTTTPESLVYSLPAH